jgi:hypothetical protein
VLFGDARGSFAMRSLTACAIAAGGTLLIWPAFANSYPLLFSDTGSFMDQLLLPTMIWDKPWIYGPVLVVISLKLTLWLPVVAQGLLTSWVMWRVQGVFRAPSPIWHLGLCLVLALGSAAPWFASMLMPDILAPLTVLMVFLLAFDPRERGRVTLMALATFAIAAHLTHLLIAAACLVLVLILRPRAIARAAVPLAAAMVLLLTTNLIGFGRIGLSPHGAVFGLARLVADGPARIWLDENCPDARYRMCEWKGRLPTDANVFLWDPEGPVWTWPGGPIALAPEASCIVVATIISYPWAVAHAALGNWLTQLIALRLDKVIGANGLDATVGVRLHEYYPAAEEDRFKASAQRRDNLRAIAAPWQTVYIVLLEFGAVSSFILLVQSRRRDPLLFALIAEVAIALVSNAFATGALSGPHDRYQARLAWLALLPPAIYAMKCLSKAPAARAGVRDTLS